MSKKYSCELCKITFDKKINLTNHKKNKGLCIPSVEIDQIKKIDEYNMDKKSELKTTFKNCLDILRSEGLVGEKALRNLSYFLILKLIEPHFGVEIDIDEYDYDLSHIDIDNVVNHKKRLLEIVRLSGLVKENEDNLVNILKYLWDDILSEHPKTKNIFLKGKGFDIQYTSTYKKIIDKISAIDLTNTEYDVLGGAYEEVIQDIMTGKVLGQFFTQPLVKKMMVKLIDPKIYPDGTIDSCGDPTMGTGGFLITYLQYILKDAKEKNIKPDWDFIKKEGLYGKELEPDTYQLAVSNMLISSGHMFDKLEKGDSIREPIKRKFDNILANPPFGIKGIVYDEIKSLIKNEYVPIETNNAVSLFIQAIICMLKIDGKCAVVLPDGQDLFSKTNKTLVMIREYLLKTCDLKEIIYLPSGIFENTAIKTCVFYFIKKMEGTDILEAKIKNTKAKKNSGKEYKFSNTHQTTNIKFYEYDPYNEVKKLFVDVPIEKIVSNSYSLNYAEYIETKEEKYGDGIVIKTLGEVCEFQNGTQIDKKDIIDGNIPIFGGGKKIMGFHNNHNRNGNETIVCGTGVYAGYINNNLGKPFWASQCFTFKSKNINIINDKYLYYYSKIILEPIFIAGQKGTAIPFIRYSQIIDKKIPIPSIEKQEEIVKYLDFIYEKAIKSSEEKIKELKTLNEFCLNTQKIFGNNVIKTLGEVCEINYGKRIVKSSNDKGEYPVFGSGRAMFSTTTYNREGYNILIGRFALSPSCVRIINEKLFLNDSGLSVKSNGDTLIHKYIGYYLINNQYKIYNCARGTGQKNLDIEEFKSIKVPIPSLEKQEEIVKYCEFNDELIKQLEKEIENNKKQAQMFINSIINKQDDDSLIQNLTENDSADINEESDEVSE
jgi:type I restriction-modification system DNA methylase subunit